MLQGPHSQAIVWPRIVINHLSTQKEVVFVAAQHELDVTRHLRSWVLPSECDSTPASMIPDVFRRSFFSHKFSGESGMVLVHRVSSVNRDHDSGLWWTNDPLEYTPVIFHVMQLSSPMVGIENLVYKLPSAIVFTCCSFDVTTIILFHTCT